MKRRTKWIAGTAVGLAVLGAGAGAVVASGIVDTEAPITGAALEKASRATLDHTKEGRVTDTEVGDEDGYYEVEVTLSNGKQVDVHLDESFNVISQEADEESPDDKDTTP